MPTSRHIQTSFTAGEFDPLLWSREDVAFFYNSARILENAVPLPQGGAKRREGWAFRQEQRGPMFSFAITDGFAEAPSGGNADNAIDNDSATELQTGEAEIIDAISNADPAVVTTEGNHGWSTGDRVIVEGVNGMDALTGTTKAISNVTRADPGVVTATDHGFSTGDIVRITGVTGMVELNNSQYSVTTIDANSFSIGVDTSGFTAYGSGGTAELVSGGGINGLQTSITVLSGTTFELDGFDSSSLQSYTSGGTVTRGIGTATEYPILVIDLGEARPISAVDVEDFQLRNLTRITAFNTDFGIVALQHSDDALTWTNAVLLRVGNLAYTRRFAKAPGQVIATKRYWRIAVFNPIAQDFGGATAALSEITFLEEATYRGGALNVGGFKLARLTADRENEYILWMVQRTCDIFRGDTGAWVASVPIPHNNIQVSQIKVNPYLDSVILYQQDQPPYLIQRLGTNEDWRSAQLPFDSVTEFPFEDEAVGGGENEIQLIEFDNMGADYVSIEFAGNSSADFLWSSSALTNAQLLQNAINSLPDISGAVVSVKSGSGRDALFTVEFTGPDANQSWPILVVAIITGSGTAIVTRTQGGRPPFAALWSPTRGYPKCGTFYQGRHWMGGFKARPDVIVGSRAGSLFDFKEDKEPVVGSPIVVAPNIDDQVTVENIYPGRNLQIFTSSAELYVPDEPITIDNIALKVSSRHGASEETQPVDIQGGTLFIDRNGQALREYLYTDDQLSYTAEPISLLAGHLVNRPRSLVLRRALDIDEPALLLLANTGLDREGDPVPAAMCVIDRAQQVTAFCRIKTQGTPLEFSTTQGGNSFVVTRRELDGEPWNFLEQFDDTYLSDCSVKVSGSGSTIDLSDYPWLRGQEVFVHLDGTPGGRFTVSGADQVDLGALSFSEEAEVGLEQKPRVVLHPYKGRGDMSPTMQGQRIFRMLLQLNRTGSVAVTAADGGRPRDVALQSFAAGAPAPTAEELLFTGSKRISGVGKWQVEPTVEVTQLEPMPFLLRSITYDVRF